MESHLYRVPQTPKIGAFPAQAPPAPSGTHTETGRMFVGVWATWEFSLVHRGGMCVPEDKGRKEKLGGVGTRALSGEEKVEIPSGEKGRNLWQHGSHGIEMPERGGGCQTTLGSS